MKQLLHFSGLQQVSLILFLLLPVILSGNPDSVFLKIRVLSNKKPELLVITPSQGHYEILSKGKKISELPINTPTSFQVHDNKIRVKKPAGSLGRYDSLELHGTDEDGILTVSVGKETYRYDHDLLLTITRGYIQLINRVNLENYTASVVLSEGGDYGTPEFYKLQGLISRTYALKNIRKHEKEGYHLCDQVHCQLYRGHIDRKDILNAMFDTKGLVILGPDTQLISAAFHSNSGGETVNSEEVWSLPMPYLRAVDDSFSLEMPMARWEVIIPTDKWMNYLVNTFNFPVKDSLMLDSALHFSQPHRKANYVAGIPLKELRKQFKLRSTFFDIEPKGNQLIIHGRGYGHGVGLSQEGALNMTRKGYCYEEILQHYYQEISITPLDLRMIPVIK